MSRQSEEALGSIAFSLGFFGFLHGQLEVLLGDSYSQMLTVVLLGGLVMILLKDTVKQPGLSNLVLGFGLYGILHSLLKVQIGALYSQFLLITLVAGMFLLWRSRQKK